MRNILTLLAVAAAAPAAVAQLPARQAAPIDRDALDRLNLRADWNAYIPVAGQRDGLAHVQPVDDQQIYVQTKAGLLVAVDARTGRQQWSHQFANSYAGSYPVAVNVKYCFAVNLGKVYCFNRYTGSLMLEQDLREAFPHREETPVSGPVADNRNVYLQMASGWLISYLLPPQLEYRPEVQGVDAKARPLGQTNVADQVAKDYATYRNLPATTAGSNDYRVRYVEPDRNAGTNRDQATPSISALHSVVPPYELNRREAVPSLAAMPGSILPPYTLVPEHLKYNQPTPSINSQSALYRLDEDSSLRAVGDKLKREWRYVTPQRSTSQPVLVDNSADPSASRVWVSTVGSPIVALNKVGGSEEVVGKLPGVPLSPLVGPYAYTPTDLLGFVSLDTGIVLAIDLTGGFRSPDRKSTPVVYEWKSPVGGQMDHPPIAGPDAVYVSGTRNGCAKLDAKTGELRWRTDRKIDQVLAVNRDYMYARDGRGTLTVFALNGRPDPRTEYLRPSTSLSLPEFTVGVSNTQTDRILLGGDNGLLVCLRDASAKYAKPTRMAPPATLPPPKKAAPMPVDPGMGE
jgi:outer membrane protein assembly factor BamB